MKYDVIVIGGGHAGCEAAHASAKLGCATAMILPDIKSIARMSCNPAIGGPGKSQIVSEIDALGGLMASVTDRSGIQFRTLNASKGAAVRANRAQADTAVYENVMMETLQAVENLSMVEGSVSGIIAEGGKVLGVRLKSGEELPCKALIVCTGTFLNGLLHTGMESRPGGRNGEPPSKDLSESLKKIGFELSRMKTGTPPRLHRDTINYSKLAIQPGDIPPRPFSFFTEKLERPAVPCHLTWTNEKTHEVIRRSFDRSPLFTGVIEGIGPRYCPSIEDKVVRFPERNSHHIFIEPVSQSSSLVYPNGISTSLPADVQLDFVRTVSGLEDAQIVIPGYAVEYDFAPPTQIFPTLETKLVSNLYFAGQINGTSGYEEAAGQGILAGINAALKLQGREPVIFRRQESYIGVMVDDLTTLGTDEPYRMFTSRAEHRLLLRQDNADTRFCGIGREIGLLPEEKYLFFLDKQRKIKKLVSRLKAEQLTPSKENLQKLKNAGLPEPADILSLAQYLKRPDVSLKDESVFGDMSEFTQDEIERSEIEIKYEGYITRQKQWIKELEGVDKMPLGRETDYKNISGLSREVVQKLESVRPVTFGQASRISGVTPAALSMLLIHLKTGGGKTKHVPPNE
ncbi:MAG: tRNA uridine-5-carboxymethylaminomethyl(34) synthesis enzyme MnmG [Nitrospinota bacterium]|nr:tRNA uridine-5-carboxymethylaminomethyl(34) synthesis enzyme MnmG [Nitrospinota bacterium]